MKNLTLVFAFVALLLTASGCCTTTSSVITSAENMGTPVSAMANRYAALVKLLRIDDATKLKLLDEMEKDLHQFGELHERVVKCLEGDDIFNVNDAAEFAQLALEIRAKLNEE